ncbi:ribonuclease T(2) [Ensifer sp. ENS09]|uniref:ribonuclease T2 family protein n=1 Tax=Ensifer sp. ENS09 TaxID=2769263 RepID=UPI00177D31C4|nr:ribonuclease T(2) [Ensifer sp. ENS09]MBD9648515.1 ribonuclease T(2) [Ensifer sp. ENS09]
MKAFRNVRRLLPALFIVTVLAACNDQSTEKAPTATGQQTTKAAPAVPLGSGFDFYVLSLSWSPTWCGDNDPKGKSSQCEVGGNRGLIVHGLWPQNERGYPDFCPTRQSDRVPSSLGKQYLDLIPSMGLIGHQWRKHGTCSGLSQEEYFAVTRAAWERLTLPSELAPPHQEKGLRVAAIEDALLAKNPGMTKDAVAVTCEGNRLEEIRICFDKSLNFRACPAVDRQACRKESVSLPPAL